MIRRTSRMTLALALVLALAPRPSGAQALPALAGAAGGLVAGAVVTVGWIVEQATFEEQFLHSARDLYSPTGSPLVLAPAAGFLLGLTDSDLLGRMGIGAGAGLLAGVTLGVGAGHLLAGDNRSAWAGGAMGAAVGVLAGIAVAVIAADDDGDGPVPDDAVARRGVPIGLSIRF